MFGSQQECLEQCYFQLFPYMVVALWGSIGGEHSHLCHCESLCYAVVSIVTGSSYIAIVVEGSKCLFYIGVYHRREVKVRRLRKQEKKSCHISYNTWPNLFFFVYIHACVVLILFDPTLLGMYVMTFICYLLLCFRVTKAYL